MIRTIAARLVLGLGTFLAVSMLVFLGMDALVGDAATAALGRDATPEAVAVLRKQFGLNRPVAERYTEWIAGLPRGDLGKSLPSGDPVWQIIRDKARNTLLLALATIVCLVPLSIALGVFAALRRDSILDHVVSSGTLVVMATPEFVVGSLLAVICATWFTFLPPVSLIDSSEPILPQLILLVLPVLTLLGASLAQTIRMIRASMLEVLDSNYIQMARLKGVPEKRVLMRHALPNALAPTITILAFNVAWLTGGIVVVESVFQFPGLGMALTQAVSRRDIPTVQAIALIITGAYISVNLIADTAIVLLNPRLRASST
jgi:peptide/nickel transport system permease protein